MAITIDLPATKRVRSLEAFIDHLEADIELTDPEGLSAAAGAFLELSNDADLVAAHINRQIEHYFTAGTMATNGPQSILMGSGTGFFLRANIWLPPRLSGPFASHEARLYSYESTHDHNFGFMTVAHFGPGYTTDLYRYEPAGVTGYEGELVDLEFVETTALVPGRVMVYEEKRDVHTQHAPDAISISLNVMVVTERIQRLDQYFFDPHTSRISGMPGFATIHQRASIVELAGHVANGATIELLADLLERAPCRRVRESAVAGITHAPALGPSDKAALIERAMRDADPVVRASARGAIETLHR